MVQTEQKREERAQTGKLGADSLYPLGRKAFYQGRLAESVAFISRNQLKDRGLWAKFVAQFGRPSDDADGGWRGEYWGKMMRGACMAYSFTRDETLYDVLHETVSALLDKQDGEGRISTYSKEKEFSGWDVWSRKYVLTGFLFFHEICHDEVLKRRLRIAMCRHADYIIEKVGEREEQIPITATSNSWGGVNSCSILEAFVLLYKLTGERAYLDFAAYLVRSGGCANGNLIDMALAADKKPHQYPTIKAYEVMSYFTGVLEYYTVTGEQRYLTAVSNFADSVIRNEITVIGCAGCTNELFDNAAVRQTEYRQGEMQETCVTVTWMLLCHKMLRITGESRFADLIEQSGYNAMLGSVNFESNISFNLIRKTYTEPVPFDSYSPLYMNKRGKGVGGYKEFEEGGFYGCCAVIGAAGVSLMPATAVVETENGIAVNYYLNGIAERTTPQGRDVSIRLETNYPASGHVRLTLRLPEPECFTLSLRLPDWSKTNRIAVGGENRQCAGGRFYQETRVWADGDTVALTMENTLRVERLNGCVAFFYGPLVLARDTAKDGNRADIRKSLPKERTDVRPDAEILPPQNGEQFRAAVRIGQDRMLLTDYASCGRSWPKSEDFLTVWLPSDESAL